jgi:hypothetical protein
MKFLHMDKYNSVHVFHGHIVLYCIKYNSVTHWLEAIVYNTTMEEIIHECL